MKILSIDPKTYAVPGSIDSSRLGFHAESVLAENLTNIPHGVVIVGLADDTGVKNVGGRVGAKLGPEEARKKLYRFTTGKFPFPIYDLGDFCAEDSIEKTHSAYAEGIQAVHASGHLPLVIGGGHDLAYPEALALLRSQKEKRISFLNIDAHLDLRPTTNGITSGSPWYLLLESEEFQVHGKKLVEFGVQRHCNAHSLVDYAFEKKVELHWFPALAEKKMNLALEKIIRKLARSSYLQVSLDIDSVSWKDAPGCSAPQTVGFRPEDVIAFSNLAGKYNAVNSFGIYELSPPLDRDGQTATLVAHCLHAFLKGFATRKPLRRK